MKSKISFFNKTIFMKNVTLYWPIWGIYTLILLLMQPATIWLCNNMSYFANGYSDVMQFRDLMGTLGFGGYVVLIAFGALLSGMALYSYLYNSKSANMIHALPVDRTQLFGTTLISGWTFLIAPLFVTALLSSLFCIIYTIPGMGYIWLWFLNTAALVFIAFSIVTICALFTGHIVVLPMYVAAVNILSWLVYFLVNTVVTTFGFGVTELGDDAMRLAGVFCPIQCFGDNLRWQYEYSETREIIGVSLEGTGYIWVYLVAAILFYVSAYIIYRKRKIEHAGDFFTVNWVKPIFRGVVSVMGAIYGGMIVRAILLETRLGCSMPVFICFMLVAGVVCYFAADMFIRKSFHVFCKRNWFGCAVSSVVVLAAFFGMYGLADLYEKNVPDLDDLKYAEIRMGYDITLYGEDMAAILDIQKDILEKADYIESRIADGDRYYDMVTIRYQPKGKQWIYRRYPLSMLDESLTEIYNKIAILEGDEENYLVNTFGKDYANVSVFYGGNLNAFLIDPKDREKEDFYPQDSQDTILMDESQAKEIYYAMIADIKAGTLMKYNVNDGKYAYEGGGYPEGSVEYYGSSGVSISLEYQMLGEESDEEMTWYEDDGYMVDDSYYKDVKYVYLDIGPDCENVINKLIELEIIESIEHVWWGGAEELLK